VAETVLAHGTGALNVDGCRVGTEEEITATRNIALGSSGSGVFGVAEKPGVYEQKPGGRFPANLIHDGSPEVVGLFPETGRMGAPTEKRGKGGIWSEGNGKPCGPPHGDSGSAARFFYTAKASRSDRDEGCETLEAKARPTMGNGIGGQPNQQLANNRNTHPTVKPTDLMRYLCRLITPPGGLVVDPYLGSGSTGKAAVREGFRFLGIELEPESYAIACQRIAAELTQGDLFRPY
jgi:site-specific DNA-methyltransferase (adenine-specific)